MKRFLCSVSDQGHSEGSCHHNMTVSSSAYPFATKHSLNLMVYYNKSACLESI